MSSPPNSDANTPSMDQNVKRRRRRGQQDQYPIRQYTPTTPMLPREGVSTGPSPIGLRLTRIYVGNLPQHMRKEDALIGFFSRYGDITKVNIATGRGVNNNNNRPQQQQQAPPSSTSPRNQQRVLNYGFIQYLNGSSADAAVLDVKGRREAGLERLRVGYAKTKPGVDDIQGDVDAEPLPPLPEGATDPCRVFVAGFQNTETVEMLGDFLSQWGLINLLQLVMDRETGHSKGFGFVQFSCPEGAQRLLSEMMNKGAYEKQQEEEEQQQETKAATHTLSSGVVKKPVYYQQLIVRGRMIDCKYRVSKEGAHGPSSASQSSGGAPPPAAAAQFGLNDEEKSMYTERAIARHVAKVEESRRRRGITAAGPAGAQQPMLTLQGDAPYSQEVAQYNNSNDNTTTPPPPPPPPPPTGYVNEVPSNNTAVTNPNDNIQPYQQALPSQYQPPYRGSRQLDSTGQWGGGPHPPPTSGGGGVAYSMPLSSTTTTTTREGSGYMNDAGLTSSYTGIIQKPAQASGYGGSSAPPLDTTQQQQQPTGGGGYGSYYQPPTPQPQRRDAAATSGVSLPRIMGSSSSSSEYRDDREHRWQRQEQVSPSSSSLSSPSPTQYTPLYAHHHQQQPSSHGRAIITPRRSPRRASSSSAPSREAYRYTADGSPARRRDQQEYPQPQQLYGHSPKRPRTSRTSSPPVAGSWYSVEVARNNTITYSDEDDDDEYTIR